MKIRGTASRLASIGSSGEGKTERVCLVAGNQHRPSKPDALFSVKLLCQQEFIEPSRRSGSRRELVKRMPPDMTGERNREGGVATRPVPFTYLKKGG